jgi:hypothetical protein
MRELLDLFPRKFAPASFSPVHILKSLACFEDAGKDPLPEMLVPLDWDQVKRSFTHEALRLL